MAEPLINNYGPEIPRQIADQIKAVDASFQDQAFIKTALIGYEKLSLMERGQQIAKSLETYLPADYEEAIGILVASMGPRLERDMGNGMAPFIYLPHSFYIANYGLNHFEASMQAIYQLTKRFTGEFCIRPFLEQHTQATLERLHLWAEDECHYVRRLASEGPRPRLPWASHLPAFKKDPSPVLALLEKLKDDPELYVRRSVANNLNDIGKDHPKLLLATTKSWLKGADKNRLWLIRHALRSLVKQSHPKALEQLGYGQTPQVEITQVSFTPKTIKLGEAVELSFELHSKSKQAQKLLIDFCVYFVKANATSSGKVFKLKTLTLPGNSAEILKKKISFAKINTRKHYPGEHLVELLINGKSHPLGSFLVHI
ncbi:DNA alkylation repair protein [Marinospirillum insulare]|uniref:3-methyladenine DNA glycosylase AlkC n=1 Tax=Marinospirillum insulare TaxID=217169 RepID=A0ABQ5ZUX0_9GAMM|nr:DNA alkylation repair protein [Marinospirillum insulare]GLR63799.1 hypothetical protein GCM10007878_12340 [Marinospirillum insulare]